MSIEIQLINSSYPNIKPLLHAVDILKKGGVIVYPTDTIYGLAADILNRNAVERIFKIKKTSKHKLLSLICADFSDIGQWANVSNDAFRIMRRVLPGKFTFILPASQYVPKTILQKRRTVGVRIPDSVVARTLVKEMGRPLLSSSVPKGTDDYFTSPGEIAIRYKNEIDLILDAGIMPNLPSTIVDFSVEPPEIVREGDGDIERLTV